MALNVTFYDGIKYHRQDFINRDKDFFGNGVVNSTDFGYTLPGGMQISIGAGTAWVDGYRVNNDSTSNVVLTVSAADTTNPRIDIAQVGHDDVNSLPSLIIKKGVAAASPVEPNADPGYVKLYAINVAANATSISSSNITDRRALVPLNVSATQIALGGATAPNQTNNFTVSQQFTAANNSILANQIILGQTSHVSAPASPIYLAASNAAGVGMDQYGNLLPIAPASVTAGTAWSVSGKSGNKDLQVFIDGTHKVSTLNNTLDDGSGNMTVAGTSTLKGSPIIAPVGTATSSSSFGSSNIQLQSSTWNGSAAVTNTRNIWLDNSNNIKIGNLSGASVASIDTAGNLTASGNVNAPTLQSTVATGTAPFTVASTTKVTNLNADLLDGFTTSIIAAANTIPVYNASAQLVGNITGNAATATKMQMAMTLSLTGDATGSASFDGSANTSIPLTLANSGVTAGTYNNVTVNAKGLVTSASTVPYITGNQNITFSGDATGSGTTAVTLSLKNTGTPGTYTKVTTDAQGRVTSGTNMSSSDITSSLGFTPLNKAGDTISNLTVTNGSTLNGSASFTGGATFSSGQTVTFNGPADFTGSVTIANGSNNGTLTLGDSTITKSPGNNFNFNSGITTVKNVLDDTSGNMSIAGLIAIPNNVANMVSGTSTSLTMPATTDTLLPFTAGSPTTQPYESQWSNGVFTAPATGLYLIFTDTRVTLPVNSAADIKLWKYTTGGSGSYVNTIGRAYNANQSTAQDIIASGVAVLSLAQGESIKLFINASSGSTTANMTNCKAGIVKVG